MTVREGNARAAHIDQDTRLARIRALNDGLRVQGRGGYTLVTRGLIAMGRAGVIAAYQAVAEFSGFEPGNDPHGEHDFGAVEVLGQTLFWKIDAYDREQRFASPDPADPRVTVRVMTIMLAEEY